MRVAVCAVAGMGPGGVIEREAKVVRMEANVGEGWLGMGVRVEKVG